MKEEEGKRKREREGNIQRCIIRCHPAADSSSSIATRDNPDNRVRNFGSADNLNARVGEQSSSLQEAALRDRIKIMFRAAVFPSLFLVNGRTSVYIARLV